MKRGEVVKRGTVLEYFLIWCVESETDEIVDRGCYTSGPANYLFFNRYYNQVKLCPSEQCNLETRVSGEVASFALPGQYNPGNC